MSFLSRLKLAEPFETWPRMELAAEQRYWDGLTLALANTGNENVSIYLFGYVAEMLLKTAYFQVIQLPRSDNIVSSLKEAQKNAFWLGGNLHNLRSWVNLLNEVRAFQGIPWHPVMAASIERHVLIVESHWRESIRYTSFPATATELEEVFTSVDWLRANSEILWR